MRDYRDLDWEMFTGHMFSKAELDEIYQQGRADERKRFEDILNRVDVDSDNGEVHSALDTIRGML